MADDAPKSAFDLAMERLRQKDREAGTVERQLSAQQRGRIAEIRAFYEAKLAELSILSRPSATAVEDQEALETLEDKYRSERERLQQERDGKIAAVRAGWAAGPDVR
jgi:ABC-type protease/lipase transport system fused ATPase/permease subunit